MIILVVLADFAYQWKLQRAAFACYRQQRSWGKVIFSQASVILFKGGGGGIPACITGFQAHSQGGSLGGSGPGPQPRGKLRGIWPGGGGWRPHVTATAAGGMHPLECILV